MAIKLENKPNVKPPDADYPYGSIRDKTADVDGTPVTRMVYDDFHQFFMKLADDAGVTLNDLPDNAANGFQLFEAFMQFHASDFATLPSLNSAFSNAGTPWYQNGWRYDPRRKSVRLRGSVALEQSVAPGIVIATLPNDARPSSTVLFSFRSSTDDFATTANSQIEIGKVNNSGEIIAINPVNDAGTVTIWNFDGVTFSID